MRMFGFHKANQTSVQYNFIPISVNLFYVIYLSSPLLPGWQPTKIAEISTRYFEAIGNSFKNYIKTYATVRILDSIIIQVVLIGLKLKKTAYTHIAYI